MDTKNNMIILKGKIRTSEVESCKYNNITNKYDVQYKSGKIYSFNCSNVKCLKEPQMLNPQMYQIICNGKEVKRIKSIHVFTDGHMRYWHLCMENGKEEDYFESELEIKESSLVNHDLENVFLYLKKISQLCDIKNPENQDKMLPRKYEKIGVIGKDIVLSRYLGLKEKAGYSRKEFIPIFPFGCNNSQYEAVKKAMENQLSVIQGPPGTGKTQTILNIIANILMQGKTVQIVSNNNPAIDNVYNKLASPEYQLGFIAAMLGRRGNKEAFIKNQSGEYPDFSNWKIGENSVVSLERIREKSMELKRTFDYEEGEARLKQELQEMELELKYFNNYLKEAKVMIYDLTFRSNIKSDDLMELWQIFQEIADENKKISFGFKIRNFFRYGIHKWGFYKQKLSVIIASLQKYFYVYKRIEICNELSQIAGYLSQPNRYFMQELCDESMILLKERLAEKYKNRKERPQFCEDDLWRNPHDVLDEYPVVLSTTFSSRGSLGDQAVYDYVIMDEASQVDIATGALALSCARNAVIVGDTKQLPNVITPDIKRKADTIFNDFHVAEGYRYTNSFLQSVLEVIPNVQQTLLKEHYRCHPKIINFCNQKFYNGELVIMTKDCGEDDVLTAAKSVPGNHARGHYSQRQIDIIKNEIIPQYVRDKKETGIIAPYNAQVEAMENEFTDIDVKTVHKFQGREKDTIIISTVDDEITDFVDDPYLLNVAVSRARKKLVLVVSGNEQSSERNISDLIAYIKYNNFEVTESKVYSVFDYLYRQYAVARNKYLQLHKRVSEYDSENLMYALIDDILKTENYTSLKVVCHFPVRMLIRNPNLLDDEDRKYAMHPATHLDFLIFNRVSKQPVLAVEVDGFTFHKSGTVQAKRDIRKNRVLELCGIPLLRFMTNGSGEKEILRNKLREIHDY